MKLKAGSLKRLKKKNKTAFIQNHQENKGRAQIIKGRNAKEKVQGAPQKY